MPQWIFSKPAFNADEQEQMATRFVSFTGVMWLGLKLYNRKFWLVFILPTVLQFPFLVMLMLLISVFLTKLDAGVLELVPDGILLIFIWMVAFTFCFIGSVQWSYLAGISNTQGAIRAVLVSLKRALSVINYYMIWVALVVFVANLVTLTGLLQMGSGGPVVVLIILPFIAFFAMLSVYYTKGYILSRGGNVLSNLYQSVLDISSLYTVNLFRVLKLYSVLIITVLSVTYVSQNIWSMAASNQQNWFSGLLYVGWDAGLYLMIISYLTAFYYVSFENVDRLNRNAKPHLLVTISNLYNNLLVGLCYGSIVFWFILLASS